MGIVKRIVEAADKLLDKAVESSSSMTEKESRNYFKRTVDGGFYGHYNPARIGRRGQIKTTGGNK